MSKETSYSVEKTNPISLREERRLTGRYVAAGTAICITLLGLYQAMVQHTPIVAGLFAPALIMFLYVFWVLYTASKTNKPKLDVDSENTEGEEEAPLAEVTVNRISNDTIPKEVNIAPKESNISPGQPTTNKLNRTYSIA